MLATTLSSVFDTSTMPLAATTPCGLSRDAPCGAVKVTALIVGGVVAEAVTTLLAAVVTTVPHTARATAARRVRLVGMGRHLSLVGVEVGQRWRSDDAELPRICDALSDDG